MEEQSLPKRRTYQFVLVFLFIIFIARYWYQFLFNLVFIGYNIFEAMSWGIVFACILWRIFLYPQRIMGNYFSGQSKKADAEHEKVLAIQDDVKRKELQNQWFSKNHFVLVFMWFSFCFLIMNALMAGRIFFFEFTPERIAETLYTFVPEPDFPLNTTSWIPLVGQVDLTQINQRLNFISAVGVGVVGLADIIIHKKNSRRELIMLLFVFPLGAFLITSQVPSGFEFAMAVLEILTIFLILFEGLIGGMFKKMRESDSLNPEPQPYSLEQFKKSTPPVKPVDSK